MGIFLCVKNGCIPRLPCSVYSRKISELVFYAGITHKVDKHIGEKNKMENRGRPAKPAELKRILGNPGRRPLPDLNNITHLPMAREIPPAPEGLGLQGINLWDRSWSMAITWLSPDSDLNAVKNAAFLADANEAARNKYMNTLEANDGRAFVQINKSYTDALSSLGFDPVSRSRLGVAEVRAATSIDKLLQRRQDRARVVNSDTIINENGEVINEPDSN